MGDIQTALRNFGSNFLGTMKSIGINDIIDIIVVAYLLYHAIRLVRETRAMQLVKGLAAILVMYFVASVFELITLSFFIRNILQVGIFLLVVLFQPELRRALEQMGRTKLSFWRITGGMSASEAKAQATEELIDILVNSCQYLSERKTGALMVIERDIKLGDVINTGTIIDSRPSLELIGNIFYVKSPLHDGAMVIRDGRLYAAGCYLTLSQNMEIARDLGTRHRAALGMSEVSDAIVLVVSEETGAISVTQDSRLQRGLSAQNLRKLLHKKLLDDKDEPQTQSKIAGFWKVKK